MNGYDAWKLATPDYLNFNDEDYCERCENEIEPRGWEDDACNCYWDVEEEAEDMNPEEYREFYFDLPAHLQDHMRHPDHE